MSALTKTAPIEFAGLADEGLAVTVSFSGMQFVVIGKSHTELQRFAQVLGFQFLDDGGGIMRVVVIDQKRTHPIPK